MRDDILEGLKLAVSKGETLQNAMMSFYNSGYPKEEIEEARQKYYSHIEYRKTHHPMEYPNCGSVFKNIFNKNQIEKVFSVFPETKELSENKWYGKVSIGYLIKKLGFSGFKIGQAQVSEKHNNFIINLGNEKFLDVY